MFSIPRATVKYAFVKTPAIIKNIVEHIKPNSIFADKPLRLVLFLYAVISCGKLLMKNMTFPTSNTIPITLYTKIYSGQTPI